MERRFCDFLVVRSLDRRLLWRRQHRLGGSSLQARQYSFSHRFIPSSSENNWAIYKIDSPSCCMPSFLSVRLGSSGSLRYCLRGNGKLDGESFKSVLNGSTQSVRRVIGGPISCRELVRVRWLDSPYELSLGFILAWKCARLLQADLLRWRARFHFGVMVLLLSPSHCSRGYQGVGPTKNERYEKKAKVMPDPVPRAEMEH